MVFVEDDRFENQHDVEVIDEVGNWLVKTRLHEGVNPRMSGVPSSPHLAYYSSVRAWLPALV